MAVSGVEVPNRGSGQNEDVAFEEMNTGKR